MKFRVAMGALVVGLMLGTAVQSGAPTLSIRPVLRPQTIEQARPDTFEIVQSTQGVTRSPRPQSRPARLNSAITAPAQRPIAAIFIRSAPGVKVSLRPKLRPNFTRKSTNPAPSRIVPVAGTRVRSICGVRAIKGIKISAIPARLPGCGVKNPVQVSSIQGVALTRAATMDCPTAKALNSWVKNGVIPTIGRLGGGVSSLKVIADYSCRTRNSKPGAKISEHGRGRAVDIAAINLKNGVSLSVQQGWNDRVQGKLLKKLHEAACGPFGTVLGPESDRYHRDHFHLDTARYRSGSYCR